ncbi:MAG: hypothetical protein GX115_01425 [Ruminiclostridium sp.]|nr:hypothetical protein [Ruminiclostridium sp.]
MDTAVIQKIMDHELWTDYLEEFKQKNPRKKEEIACYEQILSSGRYQSLASSVLNKRYRFNPPKEIKISKMKTGKKRTVYIHQPEEKLVLRIVNKLLQTQPLYSENLCFSFHPGGGAAAAYRKLLSDRKLHEKCCVKLDVHNYFNSIDVPAMMQMLTEKLDTASPEYSLVKNLLEDQRILRGDAPATAAKKGVMAGNPLAPLLANIYLSDIDEAFMLEGITYARYSDDIVFFVEEEQVEAKMTWLKQMLFAKGLSINPEKTIIRMKGQSWEFLGLCRDKTEITLAHGTIQKLKAKVYRLAKKMRRKIVKGYLEPLDAAKEMIYLLNRKLFGREDEQTRFYWSRWFFPVMTGSKHLRQLDGYIQEKLRFVVTGKYNRMNFRKVPYTLLKELGYRSLVSEFYRFKRIQNQSDSVPN